MPAELRHIRRPVEGVEIPTTCGKPCFIPMVVLVRLAHFQVDKRSGNLILNMKDGDVLAARFEEFLTVRP